MLTSLGVYITTRNIFGELILYSVSRARDNSVMIRIFLNNNIHIHVVDDQDDTALNGAIQCNSTENALLLLEAGIDPDIPDVVAKKCYLWPYVTIRIPYSKDWLRAIA